MNLKTCSEPQGKTPEPRTVIQEFYRDANIFITGATGFLGKMLIEKLLRSCPDIESIYVLVRSKRGKKVEERIDEMASSICFSRLLKESPSALSKLHAVAGDASNEGLGISEEDRHLLAGKINIVFHVAATVNFTQNLGSAIKINVRATRDMLILSKTFTNLKSFVHVSTAYAHCPSPNIDESFYPMTLECDEAIALAERVAESEFDVTTSKILGVWPNTYSFTKAIAENTVKQYGESQGLPVGILRPSVVIWTQREPVPGWLDNMYGAGGVAAGIFSGIGHTMQLDPDKSASVVPGDVVINGLIAAAWDISQNWFPSSKTPIYHCVSSAKSDVTWGKFFDEVVTHSRDKPSLKAATLPFWLPSRRLDVVQIYVFLFHFLPALLMDALARVAGKKTQLLRTYKKIHNFNSAVAYFCVREWRYEERNLVNLWNILDDRDKALFPFDMASLNWEQFFLDSFEGFRKHLMKENPDTIPAARKRMKRLVWSQAVFLSILICGFGALLIGVLIKLQDVL